MQDLIPGLRVVYPPRQQVGGGKGGRGGVGHVVRWLGGSFSAPHMKPERVEAFLGDNHSFPGIDNLEHIARVGVPVDVLPGGDQAKELAYGNIH